MNRRLIPTKIILVFSLSILYHTVGFAEIYRVSAFTTCEAGCDGSNWDKAIPSLVTALAFAKYGDQIWVAGGVYTPTTTTDRTRYFQIRDGVELYGGFTGEESSLEERDYTRLPTILSGDIGAPFDQSDNSYTIIYTKNVSASTIIDGFTIAYAQADNAEGSKEQKKGGGWYNTADGQNTSNPTIKNCLFYRNKVQDDGGAMYNEGFTGGCSPYYYNCTFEENEAKFGGAIYNGGFGQVTNPNFVNCTFKANRAAPSEETKGTGGAMYNFANLDGEVSPTFFNCLFLENVAYSCGGIYFLGETGFSRPRVMNCTFYANYANIGGAIYLNESDRVGSFVEAVVMNTIFWNNLAGFNKHFHFSGKGIPDLYISYSLIDAPNCEDLIYGDNGDAECAGGMIFNQDPKLDSPETGNFHLTQLSPAINAGFSEVPIQEDIDGEPRIQKNKIDLGIDESSFASPVESDSYGVGVNGSTIQNPEPWTENNYPYIKSYDSNDNLRIPSLEIKTPIQLFPNPALNHVSINLPDDQLSYHYEILDAKGAIAKSGTIEKGGMVTIDISSIANSGLYLMRFNELEEVFRFVKK